MRVLAASIGVSVCMLTRVCPAVTDSTGSVSTFPAVESRGPEPTLVQKLFEGTLVNETRCLTCETVRSSFPLFSSLDLPRI